MTTNKEKQHHFLNTLDCMQNREHDLKELHAPTRSFL